MCMICSALLLTLFPASISPRGTGERIPTNFEVLEQLSRQTITELISNMPMRPNGEIILLTKDNGAGDADFIFENMLLKTMREAGFRIAADMPGRPDSVAGPRYEFSYQIIKMSLAYPKAGRRYWFGAREVERFAEIFAFAQLADLADGSIIWVGDTQKKYEDIFSYSLLPTIEDERHEFTKPQLKRLRWSKLIEPVIVVGVVTGMVYLFFSNQSDE